MACVRACCPAPAILSATTQRFFGWVIKLSLSETDNYLLTEQSQPEVSVTIGSKGSSGLDVGLYFHPAPGTLLSSQSIHVAKRTMERTGRKARTGHSGFLFP
jgi:hypothetical protein